MKIDISVTEHDVRDYINSRMKRTRSLRNRSIRGLVIFFVIITVIFWIVDNNVFVVLGCDLFIACAVAFAWFRYLRRISQNSNLKRLTAFELTSDSISYTANDVTSKANWSSVQSIMNTDKFVIFVLPNQQEIPIPKHSFRSEEQYTEFMNSVKLKLNQETPLLQ
ncbi:YcxB family protein [Alicyclobacillus tolerans]|uniref:YcxB family protein n=1 Tax=Alicyclobacillus tolerans TaxID=90970 RepID=UPI001F44DFD6|nr:YcxB family protein [Alicyclobacillus tolerans]MCF8568566.1 YcxB family protein [Alicyclobacillus tolerans]